MALETAKFISGLDPANPLPDDSKDKGDDHIRLIKAALQNSLPGFPGAVLVGGVDSGVSNAYVLAPPTPLLGYAVNMTVLWLPANTNGGASTVNISGLGAQPIRRIDGTLLANGDIMAGQPVAMMYNGSEFRLIAVTKQYVDQLVFSGVLPGQAGNGGKPLITNGTTSTFSHTFGVAMDEAKGADIPAGTTLNLTSGAGTGNYLHVTGSGVTITAVTLPAGAERTLCFDGVNTLNHSGSLVLPSGANLTTAPGDVATLRGEGSGIVKVVHYEKANGRAILEQLPPALVFLASVTPTVAGAIDFLNVFSSTYDDYLILMDDISWIGPGGSSPTLELQVARSGVVDVTANYTSVITNSSTASTANAFSFITQTPSASSRTNGSIRIMNANDGGAAAQHAIDVSFVTGQVGSVLAGAVMGYHQNNGSALPLSGFRLLWNFGTFGATGSIRVYGYKKA